MKTFNLFNGETESVPAGAPGDQGRAARVGSKLGASRLGMSVYDLPPGEAIGPFHFEWTDEEWLIALAGSVVIRGLEDEQTLDPGDVVCFPAGPDGAHQVRNASDVTVRVAIVSTQNEFGIVEYPEDKKSGSGQEVRTTHSTTRPDDKRSRLERALPRVGCRSTAN